ncbi:hypothetical protein DFQ29_001561 [Apophysomyces sp. BC1021]|nr:hypothetical protein DFQ29_001561 [Apophysomyces sp. BC1021]
MSTTPQSASDQIYRGQKELSQYIFNTAKPRLTNLLRRHTEDFSRWHDTRVEKEQFMSLWDARFNEMYQMLKAKARKVGVPSKEKLSLCEIICADINLTFEKKLTRKHLEVAAVRTLRSATGNVVKRLIKDLDSGGSSGDISASESDSSYCSEQLETELDKEWFVNGTNISRALFEFHRDCKNKWESGEALTVIEEMAVNSPDMIAKPISLGYSKAK